MGEISLLVDSSIWIAAAHPKNKEYLELQRLIKEEPFDLYVATMIRTEVCQGARTEKEFYQLWDAFDGFQFLEITDQIWKMSAWNYFRCRKKGITLSTIDCLIATLSCEYRLSLWTKDAIFSQLQPILGLELRHSIG